MSVVSVWEEGHRGRAGVYPLRSCRVVTASEQPSRPGRSNMFPQSGCLSSRTSASVRDTGRKQLHTDTHNKIHYSHFDARTKATCIFNSNWIQSVKVAIIKTEKLVLQLFLNSLSTSLDSLAVQHRRRQTHGGISPTKGTERGEGGARFRDRALRRDLSLSTTSFNICNWPGSNVRQDGTLSCRLVKAKKIDVTLKR